MAAPRFTDQLNVQIGNELAAHNQYLACAIHYDALTMPQMAAFFYAQALEERAHAMMMVQYLLDTDAEVVIPAVDAPINEFADVVAPVALALEQEKRVTDQINGLLRIAREEFDFASEQFMQWFIKEQVEEVATMSDLLAVVKRNLDDVEDIEEYVAREQGGEGDRPDGPAPGRRLTRQLNQRSTADRTAFGFSSGSALPAPVNVRVVTLVGYDEAWLDRASGAGQRVLAAVQQQHRCVDLAGTEIGRQQHRRGRGDVAARVLAAAAGPRSAGRSSARSRRAGRGSRRRWWSAGRSRCRTAGRVCAAAVRVASDGRAAVRPTTSAPARRRRRRSDASSWAISAPTAWPWVTTCAAAGRGAPAAVGGEVVAARAQVLDDLVEHVGLGAEAGRVAVGELARAVPEPVEHQRRLAVVGETGGVVVGRRGRGGSRTTSRCRGRARAR